MPIPRNLTASGEVVKYSDDQATVFLATILPPGGTLVVGGGITASGPISGTFVNNVKNVAFAQSPYTVVATDETIVVDASGGAVTINLPAAVAANIGRTLYIAKSDATANGVTIQTNGGDTLNGVAGVGAILTKQLEVANIQVIAAGAWLSIAGDVTIQTVSAIDGTGGSNRDLDWLTVGSLRWQLRANSTAESGGNAGSDLNLNAYDDTGALLGAAVTIVRSTQAVTIPTLSVTTLTLTGATIVGQPTWNSSQAITLSTAAQANVTSLGTLTALSISGAITMTAAVSQIVPGATSFSVRDNANANDNLIVTNAGVATIRGGLTVSLGGITMPNGANGKLMFKSGATQYCFINPAQDQFLFNDGSNNIFLSFLSSGPGTVAQIFSPSGTITLRNSANSLDNLAITDAGLITTRDPFLRRSSVALTNNAAAQTATLTNSPTAGNPTKWIPINDNGTTRNIPAW